MRFHMKFTNSTEYSIEAWVNEKELAEKHPEILQAIREDKSCIGGAIIYNNNCQLVVTDLAKFPVIED